MWSSPLKGEYWLIPSPRPWVAVTLTSTAITSRVGLHWVYTRPGKSRIFLLVPGDRVFVLEFFRSVPKQQAVAENQLQVTSSSTKVLPIKRTRNCLSYTMEKHQVKCEFCLKQPIFSKSFERKTLLVFYLLLSRPMHFLKLQCVTPELIVQHMLGFTKGKNYHLWSHFYLTLVSRV